MENIGNGTIRRKAAPAARIPLRMRLGKNFIAIPTAFIFSLANGSASIALIFYLNDFYRVSAETIGVFTALNLVSYFVGCLVLRPLGTKLLPRHSMLIGIGGELTCLGLILAVPSLGWAFLFYACYGFFAAFFWPFVLGWLTAGIEGEELNGVSSRFSISWSLANVVSPYVGGALAERGGLIPLYLAFGLLGAILCFVAVASRALPRVHADTYRSPAATAATHETDRSTPLRFPAWISVFSMYVILGIVYNIFPVFARNDVGLSESRTGLLLLVRAVAATAGFLILGRMRFWHGNRRMMLAVQALIAVTAPLFVLGKSFWFLAAIMLAFGIYSAATYQGSIFYAASGAPDREKRMGLNEAILTAAQVTGSVAGGIIYHRLSMQAVFFCCSGVAVLGLVLQIILLGRPSRSR